jgi:hypothetical protein
MAAVLEQVPPEIAADPVLGRKVFCDNESHQVQSLINRSITAQWVNDEPGTTGEKDHGPRLPHQVQRTITAYWKNDEPGEKDGPRLRPNEDSHQVAEAIYAEPLPVSIYPPHELPEAGKAINGMPLEFDARGRVQCPSQVSERVANALYGVPATMELPKVRPGIAYVQNSHSVAKAMNGVPLTTEESFKRRGMHPNENSEQAMKAMNGVPLTTEESFKRRGMYPNENSEQVAQALRPVQRPVPLEAVPNDMAILGRHTAQGPLHAAGIMLASPRLTTPVVLTDPSGLRLSSDRARLFHRNL